MKLKLFIALAALAAVITSCNDSKSYNEYLEDEEKAVNSFLANQRVVMTIPADTVFECGEDAPYYRLDKEGNVYMQVINPGDRKNNRAEDNQSIYFRYGRISILNYAQGLDETPTGNYDDVSYNSFRYNNYSLQSSIQYGYGIQMPLAYLGIDCEVNLLVKSQYGFYDEMSYVVPYLYHRKYYKPKV